MLAYKAFEKGLKCRGYSFHMGINKTEKAQTAECGFHCAANPLDCLTYYPNMNTSEYYIVEAGGDLDEDDVDSKIACTELNIIKKLTKEEFFLHGLAYMVDHSKSKTTRHVSKEKGVAGPSGYTIVRGRDPIAKGGPGAVIAMAREDVQGNIVEIAMTVIDGAKIKANTWYGIDLNERELNYDD